MNPKERDLMPIKEIDTKKLDQKLIGLLDAAITLFNSASPGVEELKSVINPQSTYVIYRDFPDLKDCYCCFALAPKEDIDQSKPISQIKIEEGRISHRALIRVSYTEENRTLHVSEINFSLENLTLIKGHSAHKNFKNPVPPSPKLSFLEVASLKIVPSGENNATCSFMGEQLFLKENPIVEDAINYLLKHPLSIPLKDKNKDKPEDKSEGWYRKKHK